MTARLFRRRQVTASAMACVVLPLLLAGCTRAPEEKLSFNESIQPILSENCYGCHGPDSGSRKAELRLDHAEFAYQPHGKFGPAIVPGKPHQSPLVHRIEAQDPQERMPPPEVHKSLDAQQVALLRRWVQEGAEYEQHWAFIAPKKPAPPRSAAGDARARNGFAQASAMLDAGVRAILARASADPAQITFAFFGLPAYGEDSAAVARLDAMPSSLLGVSRYRCGNDMICGWAGSLGCRDGINVIAGTGSMAYGEFAGRSARAGGWGELIGDEGSAYWIACEGMNLFSRMSDGRASPGPLQALVRQRLHLECDLDLCARIYCDRAPYRLSGELPGATQRRRGDLRKRRDIEVDPVLRTRFA